MIKSKNENQQAASSKRKSRIRWLLIELLVAVVFLFLLFYRPAHYKPQPAVYNRQLSPYLTHYLIPQFYNGVQLQEPFDLVITQDGMNEIARYLPLPDESQRVNLTSPTVYFASDRIVTVAVASVHGARVIITLEIVPVLDAKGLLNVNMDKVKVGAVNVTIPARVIGRKMYADRLDPNGVAANDIRALLAASFFDGRPFDPVFDIDGKKVRITKIALATGRLTLHFEPAVTSADAAVLKY